MLDIKRGKSESIKEYENRLATNREAYKLSWLDVANLINAESGDHYSCDTYRKRYSKGLHRDAEAFVDMITDPEVDAETDYTKLILEATTEQTFELHKERQKLQLERNQINALVKRATREDTIKEIAHNAVKELSKSLVLPMPRPNSIARKTGADAILMIADWHYGIKIENIFNTYNTEIAKERVLKLENEVIKRASESGVTTLHIINLGDMIAGGIHLPLRLESETDVISQVMEVAELLAEFLANLSTKFNIEYYSVLDNHSRYDANKKDAIQLESFVRIIDWFLKERLDKNPCVSFNENEFGLDIAKFSINGFKVVSVHGDKDKQKNIIDRLSTYTQEHCDLVCSAHLHHFSADESNETLFISVGSLMGSDTYSTGLRLNSRPSQVLLTLSDDNRVDCIHKIDLD